MGACACLIIGLGNYRENYDIRGVIKRGEYIEVYNCVGCILLGSCVGVMIGVSIGGGTQ